MRLFVLLSCIILMVISTSFFSVKRIDYRDAMNINVCKSLKGNALLYFVFVDTKITSPWTEYDIQTTLDSIRMAIDWLHVQARNNNVELNIQMDYYIGKDFSTIKKELPGASVLASATEPNFRKGAEGINSWADFIAKKAGESFTPPEKDGLPEIKKPKNKERLIAYLRDEHKVESVALLFMVNNYYKDDVSIQVNTMNTDDVEFSVVSFKYPSVIAHNFLHLFGAADLHESPFRKNDKNIKLAEKEFPNEVMQNPYAKKLNEQEIGTLTKYLIGWCDSVPQRYSQLLIDKRAN